MVLLLLPFHLIKFYALFPVNLMVSEGESWRFLSCGFYLLLLSPINLICAVPIFYRKQDNKTCPFTRSGMYRQSLAISSRTEEAASAEPLSTRSHSMLGAMLAIRHALPPLPTLTPHSLCLPQPGQAFPHQPWRESLVLPGCTSHRRAGLGT